MCYWVRSLCTFDLESSASNSNHTLLHVWVLFSSCHIDTAHLSWKLAYAFYKKRAFFVNSLFTRFALIDTPCRHGASVVSCQSTAIPILSAIIEFMHGRAGETIACVVKNASALTKYRLRRKAHVCGCVRSHLHTFVFKAHEKWAEDFQCVLSFSDDVLPSKYWSCVYYWINTRCVRRIFPLFAGWPLLSPHFCRAPSARGNRLNQENTEWVTM